jgi:hypothetical protein
MQIEEEYTLTCTTTKLDYSDIFRTRHKQKHICLQQLFNGNIKFLEDSISQYIHTLDYINMTGDVVEFYTEITPVMNNWSIIIFKSYNPFCSFKIKYKNESSIPNDFKQLATTIIANVSKPFLV